MTSSRAKIHRVAALCALLLTACATTREPIVEIDDASAALGRARAQDAARLAPEELRLAEDKLTAARAAAAERDVKRARLLGEQAGADADLAAARARHGAARFAVQARIDENRTLRRELLGEDRR